jgi:dihydroorotase
MRSISIIRPDDWHVHLRDASYLKTTVEDISRYFGRAIVMPNLDPPVVTVGEAERYRDAIISFVPEDSSFMPLMTLYLTDQTTPEIVIEAKQSGFVHAIKLYPAGVTTNSAAGVQAIDNLYPIFEVMQTEQMVLAVHGEVADDSIDIFDREKVFIDRHLTDICATFPNLKIVFEHISTREAAAFVKEASTNVAATVTAHHLLFNRNDLLAGGMKPVYYCLPVLKRDLHQQALIAAVTSEDCSFFLGTDSAPHPRADKEQACGCAAGAYTAHAAIELYAEVFDEADCMNHLEAFASFRGPDFYGLTRNQDVITLTEQPWDVPERQSFGEDELIPIRAGESIRWSVKG